MKRCVLFINPNHEYTTMKGLLEQMHESRVNVIPNNMMKNDGSFIYDQRRLVIHTGLCGMIEFEIAIHYLDKNWVHPKAVKTHPPFIRSAGIHVGIDTTGKRWRYHRVNGITYWIDYGWEYAKHKSRFSLWEIHVQNLLLEYTIQ